MKCPMLYANLIITNTKVAQPIHSKQTGAILKATKRKKRCSVSYFTPMGSYQLIKVQNVDKKTL